MSRLRMKHETPSFLLESFDGVGDPAIHEPSQEGDSGRISLPVGKRLVRPVKGREVAKAEEPAPPSEEEIRDRLAKLERDAYEKGFEQGQKDGLALETKQMEQKSRQLDALMENLGRLKEQIYMEAEGELVKLSIATARKIIRNEVKEGNHLIEDTIRAAMKFLVDTSHMRIRISPDDMEEVRRLLPSLATSGRIGKAQMIEDRTIEKGGCILETGFGSINATIQDQLGALEKEMDRVFQARKGGVQ